MSFTNLTPAERMKASGLISLIVVLLFFIGRTMLGALSPKQPQARRAPDSTAAAAQATAPTPGAEVQPGAATGQPIAPADAFPIAAASQGRSQPDASLGLYIQDPFVPIRPKTKPGQTAPNGDHRNPGAPEVRVTPSPAAASLPTFPRPNPRSADALPSLFGGFSPRSAPGPASVQVEPKEEKETPPAPAIRVVGVVAGGESVATLEIEQRTLMARPGDILAKNHRLVSVSDEGVVIRANGEPITLRVGAGINEKKGAN